MADEEQVRRLLDSVEGWNEWRAENPRAVIDLSRAKLRSAYLKGAKLRDANLTSANLMDAHLGDADLRSAFLINSKVGAANLSGAKLREAQLIGAKLSRAKLSEADLSFANLMDAVLNGADLRDTDLTGADLFAANLKGANLSGTELRDVKISFAILAQCNLSDTKGLETLDHQAPSTIGTDTLELTAQGLARNSANRGPVEAFLRSAGVPESIMQTFALMIENPIEFYSCFISYNHEDKAFARRVYDALQGRGIRCFLDEHDIKPGDRILDVVDHAIRLHDRILLCCSETSLNSWWVKDEIRKAMERERRDDRDIIIPLMLDSYLLDGWEDGLASDLRSRLAADFTGWESDNQKFEHQFERVVQALRAEREAEL